MDTLFEGHLEETVTIKDLLARVLDLKPAGLSFLRISSIDKKIDGRIYFQNGTRIVGSSLLDSELMGYEALKIVLNVDVGSFALVVSGPDDKITLDSSLSVDIQNLLNKIGNLPNELANLFDQDALMNEVFSAETNVLEQAVATAPRQTGADKGSLAASGSHSHISDVVQEAELSSELEELVNQRFAKAPAAPAKQTNTGQLRTLSRSGRFDGQKGLRQALLLASMLVALVVAGAVLLKQIGGPGQLAPKNFLSSPIRARSEVSSIRAHSTSSGNFAKRNEGTAPDVKQRAAGQRRRF